MALVCCKWTSDGCTWCCSKLSCPHCACDRSFPWTLGWTATLFGAQALGCAIALAVGVSRNTSSEQCQLPVWLGVQIGVGVAMIAASVYIQRRLKAEQQEHPGGQWQRLKNICNFFLFDVGACVFFVVLLFAFAWFCVGWFMLGVGLCDPAMRTMTNIAQIMSIVWPPILLFIFCCGPSFCSSGSTGSVQQQQQKPQQGTGTGPAPVVVVHQPQPVVMVPAGYQPQQPQQQPATGQPMSYSFPSKY
jgi:hypothetical protein